MAYKRALWRSGLTYRQTCSICFVTFDYTERNLGFRPWFPDGFVYCPRCKKPLRHHEQYAINPDGSPYYAQQQQPQQPGFEQKSLPQGFCTNCGRPYVIGVDHFCGGCGKKLD